MPLLKLSALMRTPSGLAPVAKGSPGPSPGGERGVQLVYLWYQEGCLYFIVVNLCSLAVHHNLPVHAAQHEPRQGPEKADFGCKNIGLSYRQVVKIFPRWYPPVCLPWCSFFLQHACPDGGAVV